ncbi:MAG TPA: PaaI family thioesterase [Bacillota bacterium]|nr:PaaI family thioesterase [Bacillota bacterium]
MELVEQIIRNDRFCFETVGIELLEITPGAATMRLEIKPAHLNGLGRVQGGAIFTLADLALAAASNSSGKAAVSVNASISYFKGVSDGFLIATAWEEAVNPRLGTYSVRVIDDQEDLVALMQATVYRKKETLEEILKSQEETAANDHHSK